MHTKVTWYNHEFDVFTPTSTWKTVGGVYIFTGLNNQAQWIALYIGQTNAFSERLPNHERWPEAQRLGATHIHLLQVPSAAIRILIERELIQAYQPLLNTEHR